MAWASYRNVHRRLREQWRPAVESGNVVCPRCMGTIGPKGEPCYRCGRPNPTGNAKNGNCGWDLGHKDGVTEEERRMGMPEIFTGPEHSCCNRRAGAKRAARKTNRQKRVWSRSWLSE